MTQTTPTKEQIATLCGRLEEGRVLCEKVGIADASIYGEAKRMIEALAAQLAEAQDNVTRLEKLVYVPGVWRCAKCGCSTVSAIIDANSGRFAANKEPQRCPNDCGPMWRETERMLEPSQSRERIWARLSMDRRFMEWIMPYHA